MANRKRITHEQDVGDIGENQVHDFLRSFGWIPDKIQDYGEDRIVRIFDKGVSSGLSFYIQVKSTENIKRYATKNSQFSYSVDVKDLEHWEASALPVILVLRDIKRQQGYWTDVTSVIAQLSNDNPEWRSQSSITFHIHDTSEMNESGLAEIRRLVAEHLYPVIAQGKDHTAKLRMVFPPTPEGKAKLEEVEHALAVGDDLTIEGDYIEEFSWPDWYTRLTGEQNAKIKYLFYGKPVDSAVIRMRLQVVSSSGDDASLSNVEFKVVKKGFEQFTLSNEHQIAPLHFVIVVHNVDNSFDPNITFSLGKPCNVRMIQEAIRFLRVGASIPSRLEMTRFDKNITLQFAIQQIPAGIFSELFARIIDEMCLIQNMTGRSLNLSSWQISPQDVLASRTIATLLKDRQTNLSIPEITITGPIKPLLEQTLNALEQGATVSFGSKATDITYELLGEKFDFGTGDFQGSGVPVKTAEAIREELER